MDTSDWRLEVRLISHIALAQYMGYRGLSVRALADKADISRSEIGNLRSGARSNCKPEKAKRIAKALDCPVDALFVPRVLRVARDAGRVA